MHTISMHNFLFYQRQKKIHTLMYLCVFVHVLLSTHCLYAFEACSHGAASAAADVNRSAIENETVNGILDRSG